MPEWLNGTVSKTVIPARVSRVRIPVSPLIKSWLIEYDQDIVKIFLYPLQAFRQWLLLS